MLQHLCHLFSSEHLFLVIRYLPKQIMNGLHLSLTRFKSIRVGLFINGSSYKDRHFLRSRAKESLKLNNTINTCLIGLKIILFYLCH